MMTVINDIDALFKELLIDNTDAGSNVQIDELNTINKDEERKDIIGYFMEDEPQEHDEHSPEYSIKGMYIFECIVASKDTDTIKQQIINLCAQVQQILKANANTEFYSDLQYRGSKRLADGQSSIASIGYQMRFDLHYLAT